jgi:hypothetical protein
MKFPDRPALNGILGVVCAIVVLLLLSSPKIVGTSQSSPLFAQNFQATSSANGSGSLSSSSSQSLLPGTSSSELLSSTLPAASSSPSTMGEQSTRTGFSVSGSSNLPVPPHSTFANYTASSSSAAAENEPTTTELSSTTNTSVDQVESSVIQTTSTTVVSEVTSPVTGAPSSNLPKVSTQSFQTLGILSIGSVIIALGSMLFVYRRVDREGEDVE